MKQKMEQGGFDASKLVALHNFVDESKFAHGPVEREKSYCFVGRLSNEKGVETLLRVASKIEATLYVLGTGPLEDELKAKYASAKQIRFMGHSDWETCKSVLLKSKFSVVPSEWYENNPFSVIEPLCLGTPVLGANIGGIPELIEPEKTGELFEMGNAEDLEAKIRKMLSGDYSFDVQPLRQHFSKDDYLEQMMSVYG
jgi:glycosyltransferase involved in cell wall biosynthesis